MLWPPILCLRKILLAYAFIVGRCWYWYWWILFCICTADVSLAQQLQEELKYEKESASDSVPDFVKEFTAQGVWEVCCDPFFAVGTSPANRPLVTLLHVSIDSRRHREWWGCVDEEVWKRNVRSLSYIFTFCPDLVLVSVSCSQLRIWTTLSQMLSRMRKASKNRQNHWHRVQVSPFVVHSR